MSKTLSPKAAHLLAELIHTLGSEDALKRELSRVSVILQREKVAPALMLVVAGAAARVHDPNRPFAELVEDAAAAFEGGFVIASDARGGRVIVPKH